MTFCLPSTHYSCRENRYLLFLTENYAALEILRHYLNDVVHSSPVDSVATGSEDSGERSLEKMEPFILFGSSFPRDKEYTQVCVCVWKGRRGVCVGVGVWKGRRGGGEL